MALNDDILAVLSLFLDRNKKPMLTTGRVVSVSAGIAKVRLRLSGSVEEAYTQYGSNVVSGDYVLLFRPEGEDRWIVGSSFTPHSAQIPTRQTQRGAELVYSASQTNISGGNPVVVASGIYRSKGGHLIVGFSGDVWNNAVSTDVIGGVRINGRDLGIKGRTKLGPASSNLSLNSTISFTALIRDAGPGQHTIEIYLGVGGTTPTEAYAQPFSAWVAEV